MPTYFVHAFRWHRQGIMIHIVTNQLDSASPGWISSPRSSKAILDSFSRIYPFFPSADHSRTPTSDVAASQRSPIQLIEEYDPDNLEVTSSPYAYVCDYVKRVDLSLDVSKEVTNFVSDQSCLGELRDQLQKEASIGWYVVVCGDEERGWPGMDEEDEEEEDDDDEEEDEEDEDEEDEEVEDEKGVDEEVVGKEYDEQPERQGEEEATVGDAIGTEGASAQERRSRS
ncbi:hypothetical protein QBC42DRAFT_275657 [Cladorrhinum samala]|uniref:Uncharacterized protein n=1 Tax=Cladorrhinum samala TaxID=585594 RepID=A0AAV9HHG1_9PEZI|nr:hypothetical protein QBC42DRAFT_275657 [Cladorrhinum samala]